MTKVVATKTIDFDNYSDDVSHVDEKMNKEVVSQL